MKNKLFKILCGVLATASLAAFVACETEGGSSASESASSSSSVVKEQTLNELTATATGTAEVEIGKEVVLRTAREATTLGTSGLQQLTLKGTAGAAVRTKGSGDGAICAANGGLLVFKELNFYNDSGASSGWSNWSLELGGKLRFENCTFKDGILLKDDAQAEFVNCTFTSTGTKKYGVWVWDGSATFTGCTFEGFRGLKVHEQDTDVTSVVLDSCAFVELSKKPGIAIGNVDTTTVFTVKNSRFTGCQPWDDEGSLEGIDGFYEVDTYTEDFAFTEENNEVDGVASSLLTKEFAER